MLSLKTACSSSFAFCWEVDFPLIKSVSSGKRATFFFVFFVAILHLKQVLLFSNYNYYLQIIIIILLEKGAKGHTVVRKLKAGNLKFNGH